MTGYLIWLRGVLFRASGDSWTGDRPTSGGGISSSSSPSSSKLVSEADV